MLFHPTELGAKLESDAAFPSIGPHNGVWLTQRQPVIAMLSSTSETPRAIHAASTAASCSAQVRT